MSAFFHGGGQPRAWPFRSGQAQSMQHAAQYSQPQSGQGQAFRPWRDGQGMGKGQIHQMTHGMPFGVPADTVEASPRPAASFRPGMAQPRPPQSTGTPYGMAATQVQGVTATPSWPQSTPARPPFASTMFDAFGNQTTPEQFYPQQQAMVSQIFDRLGQMDSGTYLGPGSPPPTWGRIPEFNYGEMWDQAGQMIQQGWQNPLQSPQPSPPAAGQQAWRQQQQSQINSRPNQSWLNSLSPANRQAYGLMQRMF